MNEITVKALVDNLGTVTDFVDDFLDSHDCPMKVQMQIDIAIDEIFSNICHYAYGDSVGEATIRVEFEDASARKAVALTFIDEGVPYNPLEKEDPDTTLSAEDRKIGGLGIYMVKKNMDEMEYEYSDGKNILSMKKYL
jgi:serine/threonine-protein kinase RsbW